MPQPAQWSPVISWKTQAGSHGTRETPFCRSHKPATPITRIPHKTQQARSRWIPTPDRGARPCRTPFFEQYHCMTGKE